MVEAGESRTLRQTPVHRAANLFERYISRLSLNRIAQNRGKRHSRNVMFKVAGDDRTELRGRGHCRRVTGRLRTSYLRSSFVPRRSVAGLGNCTLCAVLARTAMEVR